MFSNDLLPSRRQADMLQGANNCDGGGRCMRGGHDYLTLTKQCTALHGGLGLCIGAGHEPRGQWSTVTWGSLNMASTLGLILRVDVFGTYEYAVVLGFPNTPRVQPSIAR